MLETFDKTLIENKDNLKNHERNEVNLFRAKIYEDMGDYKKAVALLTNKKAVVVDQTTKHQRLANCYQKMGEKDKAIT